MSHNVGNGKRRPCLKVCLLIHGKNGANSSFFVMGAVTIFNCLLRIIFVSFLYNFEGCIMDDKKLSFEDAYKQLTELVKKMESGELPLADSVAAYEQGIKLKAYCEQLLKEAELKIETLKVTPAPAQA